MGKEGDIQEIQALLPHRYPFLLVDRILEYEAGRRIVGTKNVTINEPFFQGHFPGHPIMPGVLIIEAMAQVASLLAMKSSNNTGRLIYFMGIDKAKFRRPIVPGDQIRIEAELLHERDPYWRMKAVAFVEGKVACEAELTAMFKERREEG